MPRRECSFPQFICSRRGPAGHSGSPEVPVGWESGRVSGFTFRLTAFFACWAVTMVTPVSFTQCKIIQSNRTQSERLIGHDLKFVCPYLICTSDAFICHLVSCPDIIGIGIEIPSAVLSLAHICGPATGCSSECTRRESYGGILGLL